MEKNILRKVKLVGRGMAGIEVHYESPLRRGGIDVISTNNTKDPIAIPQNLVGMMQRVRFYFMMLFSMIDQDDEGLLSDLCDDIEENDEVKSEVERYQKLVSLSQRTFITSISVDEDNSVTLSADIEMLEDRMKNYTTIKIGPDDDFPRYHDMIFVIREVLGEINKYIFSAENDKFLIDNIGAIVKKLMPERESDIDSMDDNAKIDLYRDYLEKKGHIVISDKDITDTDPDGVVEDVKGENQEDDQSDDGTIPPIPGDSSEEIKEEISSDSFK